MFSGYDEYEDEWEASNRKRISDIGIDDFLNEIYSKIKEYGDTEVKEDDEAYWAYCLDLLGRALQKLNNAPFELPETWS